MCQDMGDPGVTTVEIDEAAESLIRNRGGAPLFKGYRNFPKSICTSVNEEVVHGIPGPQKLRDGDLLKVDVGVRLRGYCADAAVSFPVGKPREEAVRLMAVCKTALERAIATLRPKMRLSVLCAAIQSYVESQSCSVVRKYTGHGIGKEMHEDPQVPNFVSGSMPDPVLPEGCILAIEPMVNAGGPEVEVLDNTWTVVTKDRSLSAHFEHTVAIGADGPNVLTMTGK